MHRDADSSQKSHGLEANNGQQGEERRAGSLVRPGIPRSAQAGRVCPRMLVSRRSRFGALRWSALLARRQPARSAQSETAEEQPAPGRCV